MSDLPITVILPYYQAENTLKRAVESILRQTFTKFELLLIDNRSTDKGPKIARQMAQADSRIRLLFEEEQGVVFAMNKGLLEARGKFIARMDADDVALPERLEKQHAFLLKNPEIGLVGSNVRHVSDLPSKGLQRFVNWVNAFHSAEAIWTNRFVEIPLIQPSVLFRADLHQKYGLYRNGDFPEDYELFLRWLDAGVRFFQLPEVLHEWHDSTSRLTRTDSRYSQDAFYRTKAQYFAKWFKRVEPEKALWIWGAGRRSRQRARLLEQQGLKISGYYDLKNAQSKQVTCLSYQEIPNPGSQFILSMVGNYGAREKITNFLEERNYQAGRDFLLLA